MSATTDSVHEGRDQTVPSLPEGQGPESPMDAPAELEDFCEAIER
jgi:hypothetical protein